MRPDPIPRPPRVAEALLRRALPRGTHREAILGDLHEMYLERRTGSAGRALLAGLWYWRHGVAVAVRVRLRRRGAGRAGDEWTKRGGTMPAELRQDIRFALRAYRRSPGFLAVALLTLGLGIGANTAVFSVLNAMYLRPLPFHEPDRLVRVGITRTAGEPTVSVNSAGQFTAWRTGTRSFEAMAAYGYRTVTVEREDGAERVLSSTVIGGLFDLLGVEAARGRAFTDDDEGPGAETLVVLSDGYARRTFGDGDPVGSTLRIGGVPHMVTGVMPAGFTYPDPAVELWTSSDLDAEALRAHDDFFLRTVARLAPGRTVNQARDELVGVFDDLRREAPEVHEGITASVVPLRELMLAGQGPLWGTLMAAVGLVLLIACINLANVLLTRALARGREMALRRALGADRRRLVRQVLTESLVLALLGGTLGLAAALAIVRLLAAWMPGGVPMIEAVELDGPVVAFTLVTTLAAGLAFGTAPAHLAGARDLRRSIVGGTRGSGVRSALVALQVALAVMVVAAGGLTLRSFTTLATRDPGLATADRLVVHVEQPEDRPAPERLTALGALEARVRAIPGVRAVAFTSTLPVAAFTPGAWVNEPGDARPRSERPTAKYQVVSPGYFGTMGIPILRGRGLTADDGLDGTRSVVVSRRLAELVFPGEDPLGRRFDLGLDGSVAPASTVVGVVGDVRLDGLARDVHEAVYGIPELMPWWRGYEMVVHVEHDMRETVAVALREELRRAGSGLPALEVRSLDAALSDHVAGSRRTMFLFGTLAAAGLVMAMVGVFGTVAFAVAARTREIGIRMAVGADTASVRSMILRHGLAPVAGGLALGLAGSILGGGLLESLLVEVSASDPVTLAGVAVLVLTVSWLAVQIPVRRALGVDPVRVLARDA